MEEVRDYELIDFVRGFKKPRQKYESREVFTQAILGKFYGRVSSDDVPTLLGRLKSLGIISFVANDNIRFRS